VNKTTQSFDPSNPDFREGKDCMMMSYEERALDLDMVEAEHVITGVNKENFDHILILK